MPFKSSSVRAGRGAVAATAGILTLLGVAAIPAAADVSVRGPVAKDVTFTCEFPMVGARPTQAKVNAAFPDSAKAGESINVPDFHTYGGMRLESSPTESLVVKFSGATAGITATGRPLDIDDRIGGMLHVLGQPGFPVVLTAFSDDSAGAGFTPDGFPQVDTNGDGTSGGPGGSGNLPPPPPATGELQVTLNTNATQLVNAMTLAPLPNGVTITNTRRSKVFLEMGTRYMPRMTSKALARSASDWISAVPTSDSRVCGSSFTVRAMSQISLITSFAMKYSGAALPPNTHTRAALGARTPSASSR